MDTVITRSRWVLGFFIFALSICAVRLVQLQIIEGPSLAAQGQRVRTSSTEVAAARGTITDATGVVLGELDPDLRHCRQPGEYSRICAPRR